MSQNKNNECPKCGEKFPTEECLIQHFLGKIVDDVMEEEEKKK